jgi:predicted GIY-YIG superfamily endonuclease
MNDRILEAIAICEDYGLAKSERCKDRMSPHSVYIIMEKGSALYVGMTNNVRSRMYGHKATSRFWSETCEYTIEVLPTRRAALNREKELIKQLRPPFNKIHNA